MTQIAPAPTVSVIMPVYNGRAYLRDAVDSVLAQSYRDFELIAIDDGSTDDSPQILAEYGDRIVLVQDGRGGSAAIARNKGLRVARGRFVAFIDQDDLWLPEKLARQVAFMDAHPEFGLSFTSLKMLQGTRTQHDDFYRSRPDLSTTPTTRSLFLRNSIYMPTPIARRAIVEAVGGLDERLKMTDEFYLWLKMSLVTQIGFIPEVLAVYRWHDHNTSRDHTQLLVREYETLALFVSEYPVAIPTIGRRTVGRKIADQAYSIAYKYRGEGQLVEARRWLKAAIRWDPWDWKHYVRLLRYTTWLSPAAPR